MTLQINIKTRNEKPSKPIYFFEAKASAEKKDIESRLHNEWNKESR